MLAQSRAQRTKHARTQPNGIWNLRVWRGSTRRRVPRHREFFPPAVFVSTGPPAKATEETLELSGALRHVHLLLFSVLWVYFVPHVCTFVLFLEVSLAKTPLSTVQRGSRVPYRERTCSTNFVQKRTAPVGTSSILTVTSTCATRCLQTHAQNKLRQPAADQSAVIGGSEESRPVSPGRRVGVC